MGQGKYQRPQIATVVTFLKPHKMKKLRIWIRVANVYAHGHYKLIKLVRRRINRAFISQLQILQSTYYADYIEKYGQEDFTWWLNEIAKNPVNSRKFHFYEKGKVVESTEPGEPVTITITKDNFI